MGCGCGSNFSGNKKPCKCGKNPGGECQCNNRTPDSRWQRPQGLENTWDGGSSAQIGGNASQAISFPMPFNGKRKGTSKFANFLGKKSLLPKRNTNVDIKKHNISPEHYFEYNQRSFDYLRRTDDSFKNYDDLNHMDYEF